MSAVDSLAKHIEGNSYIALYTEFAPFESIQCIPVVKSNELLLMLQFIDFIFYGYKIIRLKDIIEIKHTNSDKFVESVVKTEGALQNLTTISKLTISDWSTVFEFFKGKEDIVIVDIGKESCINVGRVVDVTFDQVAMKCVGPNGKWDSDFWCEPVDNITGIEFGNSYTKMYEKYSFDAEADSTV